MINTTRSKFCLRKEIQWLLQQNAKHLIYLPDLNLDDLHAQGKLKLILVDHHYLRSKLNEAVIEIIDHHQITENVIEITE